LIARVIELQSIIKGRGKDTNTRGSVGRN